MSTRDRRNGETTSEWERLSTSMEANIGEVPHLENPRAALKGITEEFRALSTQQAQFRAQKQEASKRIKVLLAEGQKLATFLRTGLKQHYGNRNEKLVEFGLQPLRSRPRELKAKPAQPAAPAADGTAPVDPES